MVLLEQPKVSSEAKASFRMRREKARNNLGQFIRKQEEGGCVIYHYEESILKIYENQDIFVGKPSEQGYWEGVYFFNQRLQYYQGQFFDGVSEGSGVYHYNMGWVYEGSWLRGAKQGQGKVMGKTKGGQKFSLKGYWLMNKIDQRRKVQYWNQEIGLYVGQMRQFRRHGQGVFIFPNKDRFEGQWTDDQMSRGNYYFANGDIYQGQFRQNKTWGEGRLIYQDGCILTGIFKGSLCLQSQYSDKQKAFKGDLDFFKNTCHGKFQMRNRVLTASSVEGLIEGKANYQFNGKTLSGCWQQGRLRGTCIVRQEQEQQIHMILHQLY